LTNRGIIKNNRKEELVMKNLIKKVILILVTTSVLTGICYAQSAEKEGTGKIVFDNVYKEGSLFVFEYEKGIEHSPNALMGLRDAILTAQPVQGQGEIALKNDRYIIGLKISVPAGDNMIYEVGSTARENLLIGPYQLVVGGGISSGFLFKRIEDVGLKYADWQSQGVKEVLLHFKGSRSEVDIWLFSDVTIRAGEILHYKVKMP
jgi:hypothetical protein